MLELLHNFIRTRLTVKSRDCDENDKKLTLSDYAAADDEDDDDENENHSKAHGVTIT